MTTQGISPKVYIPLAVGLIVGVILLVTGDTQTGTTVLLAVAGYAGIGVAAPPGEVR